MRVVRTKKGEPWEPKSRLIIPGHLDPQLVSFRTDSPTTSPLAVNICAVVAVAKNWQGTTFDVSTAFLGGKETNWKVYIRAPKEGLPATEDQEAVPPGRLLEIIKGAFGLAEAPRLWYLRAREILAEIGWTELQCSRATFILKEGDEVIATLNLHVDDGLVLGDLNSPSLKAVIKKMNQRFHIKEWKELTEGVMYLGVHWKQQPDGTITIDMDSYIQQQLERD